MIDQLSAPFAADAVHWRAQTVYNDKALALAYIDARDVMDRLDSACGPAGWQDAYVETAKGRVVCELRVLVNDHWITKSDGAGGTAIEGDKGGISDAFKRAAVKWGVGRYLYDLNDVWAPCELKDGKWKKWKPEAAAVFAKALAGVGRPSGPITDTTRDWLQAQLDSVQCPPATLLDHLKPASLKELTYAELPRIQQFINSKKKAA